MLLTRVQRFDIANQVWLPLRDIDNMAQGVDGRFISIHRHMYDHLNKLYFADYVGQAVYEIEHDYENDGPVVATIVPGVTPAGFSYEMLVPVYYDELFLNT